MDKAPRLRFAPSPTGSLHVGGARTALFNWLYARKHGGTFVLRIEDTDQARSTDASTAAIYEGLRWLGLDWDEGPDQGGEFGPYLQTERVHLYREQAERLISEGKAYRCDCSKEDLDILREAATSAGAQFRYPGTCRNKSIDSGAPHVVRIRMPELGSTSFDDLVRGIITTPNETLQDEVILRQDGLPLYNFGAVVDDGLMKIDVVSRGDDHINNTARQLRMYEALGWPPPRFAHLPMILGDDKKRLSKRHGAVSVTAFREQGFLPHALVNYLVRLGWSLDDKSELFSLEALLEHFDFERVAKSAAIFNTDKLLWVNQHWIKAAELSTLTGLVRGLLSKRGLEVAEDEKLAAICEAYRERSKTLVEMADQAWAYYQRGVESWDTKAVAKFLTPETRAHLLAAREQLESLEPYQIEAMEIWVRSYAESQSLGLGKIAQPLRVALVGGTASPGIFETMGMIGKEESLRRLDEAVAKIP